MAYVKTFMQVEQETSTYILEFINLIYWIACRSIFFYIFILNERDHYFVTHNPEY